MDYSVGSASKCLVGTKLDTMCCSCGRDSIPNIPDIDMIIDTGDSVSHKDIYQAFTTINYATLIF